MTYLDDLFSLSGRIAVVTGAARGNGKAISEALLRAKATVVLVDVLKRKLENTAENFTSQKLNAFKFNCDLTEREEINNLIEYVRKKFRKIDILVNNAGVTFSHNSLYYPESDWEKTYKVNLKAPFLLSKEFGKMMKNKKSGVIINITSLNAEVAFPNNPAYVSFKGALKQLSKSLALDLGKYGIRVNSIGPGYFHTDMTEKSWKDRYMKKQIEKYTMLGRWGRSKDLSGLVVFLSSDSSSYITGQDIYVDGGWLSKGL